MSTIGNLKSVIRDIRFIEAKIAEREAEKINKFLDVLNDSDLQKLADGDPELTATIEKIIADGESPAALRLALYPPPPEPVKVEPPEPPPPVEVEPVKAQTNEFWQQYQDTPEAQPAPQPEAAAAVSNGAVKVRYVGGGAADGSFSILTVDGPTLVKVGETYELSPQVYENITKNQPTSWWVKI